MRKLQFQASHVALLLVLLRSSQGDGANGEQQRDFVFVEDVVDVCHFLMHHRKGEDSGLFNLGSGTARSFLDLVKAVFVALDLPIEIGFIDTPEDTGRLAADTVKTDLVHTVAIA